MRLLNADGEECCVKSVSQVISRGFSAPITATGSMAVDRVLCSCYCCLESLSFLNGHLNISGHRLGNLGVQPYLKLKQAQNVLESWTNKRKGSTPVAGCQEMSSDSKIRDQHYDPVFKFLAKLYHA